MEVRLVGYETAKAFIARWHYAIVMPAQTLFQLGGFIGERLVAVSTWGYGVRPLHTISKLFPGLKTSDYLELGRLCVADDQPKNTESRFISLCVRHISKMPGRKWKLLFTWADGILGKPGYVYQASNWLYGGYIWTDAYISQCGEKIHARGYQNKTREGVREGLKYGKRPTLAVCREHGWTQYFGKQFRYVKFICSNAERKKLLKMSTVEWSTNYPKHVDLEWKIRAGQGSRVSCGPPRFTGAVRFRSPAPLFDCQSIRIEND